jgi:hypothetical protein
VVDRPEEEEAVVRKLALLAILAILAMLPILPSCTPATDIDPPATPIENVRPPDISPGAIAAYELAWLQKGCTISTAWRHFATEGEAQLEVQSFVALQTDLLDAPSVLIEVAEGGGFFAVVVFVSCPQPSPPAGPDK